MAIVRWDPFAELNALQEQVHSLLNSNLAPNTGDTRLMPATDIYSDDKKLTVEAHLPRFSEHEITVEEHDGILEIKAEHEEKEEDKEKKYILRESTNRFYRRIALPKNADSDKIAARFENGVLKVEIPYKELPQPKRIKIGAKSNS